MEIQILGAHTTEITSLKPTSLVIDEFLALDAGSLCSSLTLSDQRKLRAILITHYHYDHVKDIPIIAMNFAYYGKVDIYSTTPVFEAISTRLLDGKLYPNFLEWPEPQPSLNFITMEAYERTNINGYCVVAIPVPHSAPAVGFQLTSPGGSTLFYTGDTGGNLSACWEHTSPDLLITEMSLPQKMESLARKSTHLSPQLLKAELIEFRRIKGYMPRIVLVHLGAFYESEIVAEVTEIARELDINITLGREGMRITV